MIYRPKSGWVVARWWRAREHRKAEPGLFFYEGSACDRPIFVYDNEAEARKEADWQRKYNDDDEIVIRTLRVRSFADQKRRAWLLGGAATFDLAAAFFGRHGNVNGDALMASYLRSMEKVYREEARKL